MITSRGDAISAAGFRMPVDQEVTPVTFASRFPCSMMNRSTAKNLAYFPRVRTWRNPMSRSTSVRLLLTCSLLAAVVTGCSRDPNVRKQKYFESGERYYDGGKYREAAIQYSNAVQVDSRFAQAHYKLGETYIK